MKESRSLVQETLFSQHAKLGAKFFIQASGEYAASVTCQSAKIALLSKETKNYPLALGGALLQSPEEIRNIYNAAVNAHEKRGKKVKLDIIMVRQYIQDDFRLAERMIILPDEILKQLLSQYPEGGDKNEDTELALYMQAENAITRYKLATLAQSIS